MTKGRPRPLQAGEILAVTLPRLVPPGREQQGLRPVVVVAIPDRPRFPMLVIVPLTASIGSWADDNPLYPVLEAGTGGLKSRSALLLDHVRAMDERREFSRIGALTAEQYAPIRDALSKLFGLVLEARGETK